MMAGQGDSCFGLRAEIRVLRGGAETDPGSQQNPSCISLVWEHRFALLELHTESGGPCYRGGISFLRDLVLSSAAGPSSGAELLGTCKGRGSPTQVRD